MFSVGYQFSISSRPSSFNSIYLEVSTIFSQRLIDLHSRVPKTMWQWCRTRAVLGGCGVCKPADLAMGWYTRSHQFVLGLILGPFAGVRGQENCPYIHCFKMSESLCMSGWSRVVSVSGTLLISKSQVTVKAVRGERLSTKRP